MTLLSILGSDSIAVPLSAGFPANELRYILDNSGALMLLSSSKFDKQAKEVTKEGLENEMIVAHVEKRLSGAEPKLVELENVEHPQGGMMLYTSGTTSRPVSQRVCLAVGH